MQPLPTPSTPPISVQRYRMEYAVQTAAAHLWMPAPRYWDGNGVRQLSILQISPPPTNRHREKNGTDIIYWGNPTEITQTFKVVFDTEIAFLKYDIDENRQWSPYDSASDLYQRNVAATSWAQADHPEIESQAAPIVSDEKNPTQGKTDSSLGGREHQGCTEGDLKMRSRCFGVGQVPAVVMPICWWLAGPVGFRAERSPCQGWALLSSGDWADQTMGFHVWVEFYARVWLECVKLPFLRGHVHGDARIPCTNLQGQ